MISVEAMAVLYELYQVWWSSMKWYEKRSPHQDSVNRETCHATRPTRWVFHWRPLTSKRRHWCHWTRRRRHRRHLASWMDWRRIGDVCSCRFWRTDLLEMCFSQITCAFFVGLLACFPPWKPLRGRNVCFLMCVCVFFFSIFEWNILFFFKLVWCFKMVQPLLWGDYPKNAPDFCLIKIA